LSCFAPASSSQPSPSQTRCRANQGKSILLSFFSFLLFLSCCLSRPRPRPRIPRLVSRPLRTRSRLPRTHRATHRVAQTLLVARPLLLFNGIVSWVSVLALALAHLRAPQPGHAVLASPGLVLGSSIIRWRRAANRDTTHPSKLTCMSTHALLHLAQPQVHQLNYSTTRRRYCALPSGPDPTPLPPLPPGLTLSSVMYSAQSTGAEVATINPAALSSGKQVFQHPVFPSLPSLAMFLPSRRPFPAATRLSHFSRHSIRPDSLPIAHILPL
jgi:hypothetical protein